MTCRRDDTKTFGVLQPRNVQHHVVAFGGGVFFDGPTGEDPSFAHGVQGCFVSFAWYCTGFRAEFHHGTTKVFQPIQDLTTFKRTAAFTYGYVDFPTVQQFGLRTHIEIKTVVRVHAERRRFSGSKVGSEIHSCRHKRNWRTVATSVNFSGGRFHKSSGAKSELNRVVLSTSEVVERC